MPASTNIAAFAYQVINATSGATVGWSWTGSNAESTVTAAFKSSGTPALLNQTELTSAVGTGTYIVTIPATTQGSLLVLLISQGAGSTATFPAITDNGQGSLLHPYPWGLLGGHHFSIQQRPAKVGSTFTQTLNAATLSFTGPTDLVKVVGTRIAGGLSFTGAIRKATVKTLTAATLTFTGPVNLLKAVKTGVNGGLSFVGSLANSRVLHQALTAVLSFTGTTNLKNAIIHKITGGLSFTGSGPVNAIKKLQTAVLSFTGPTNLKNAIVKLQAAATLSFTGAFTRKTITGLIAATLSFVGTLAFVNVFKKALTATLSFTGAQTRVITKAITGGLSFTGAQTRKTIIKLTGATLGFSGIVVSRIVLNKALTAVLSFSGASTNRTNKVFTAGLTLTGSITRTIRKKIAGTLSFTGITGRLIPKLLTASLSFTGGITSVTGTLHDVIIGGLVTFKVTVIQFTASMKPQGFFNTVRWYYGPFKFVSLGNFRAVYRTIKGIITQNRNMN